MLHNKILIVDDVEENIDILCELLNDYDLSMALNGDDVFKILEKNRPDLILLDVVMPDINGFDLCKKIKKDNNYKNIPIIFITAKTDIQSITNGLEVGGVDYIAKPFNANELIARIKTHLNLANLLRTQEQMLFQQSKLAAMGEIMDSVAHQWMQPLNLIQMKIGNIHSDYIIGETIDENYIDNYTKDLYSYISHMSTTLNEFRSFFRPDKIKKDFTIQQALSKVSILIKDDLISNKIDMTLDILSNFSIHGYENEFIHIFLNLISNSKYAFIDNDLKNREIKIKTEQLDKENIIAYEDNAGGIPDCIIDDIFNANVTTKQDEGTGMGLYMTKQIVNKHNGVISVKNSQNGAIFYINIQK